MKIINIGDRVKFLNDVGGGVVTEIVDKYLVKVLTDDDWEMPAMKNELIVVEKNEDEIIEKPIIKKPIINESSIDKNLIDEVKIAEDNKEKVNTNESILFAIIFKENDQKDSSFELYLINDSSLQMFYNYINIVNRNSFSKEAEILESNTKILLDKFNQKEIPDLLNILFQIVIFKKEEYSPIAPFEKKIKLKGLNLMKKSAFNDNDFFNEKAHLIPLFKSNKEEEEFEINAEEIASAMRQKNKPDTSFIADDITKIFSDKLIVDLHIEKLFDDYENLQSDEILKIQIEEFNKSMQSVITENIKEAIFIHGKGQGVLKTKIYTELKSNYKDFVYQDASFSEYSYGATLVMPK